MVEMERAHSKGYSSVHDHYANKMMRISLSVGVLWAMSSICLSILLVLVFLQDQWIGDTPQSENGPGNFGLWRWCSDKYVILFRRCSHLFSSQQGRAGRVPGSSP